MDPEEREDESTEKREDPPARSDADKPSSASPNPALKKLVYALCYLWGILFFLPLILYKDDPVAKRHANEGLVLLLFSAIGNAAFGILARLHSVFGVIASLYSLVLLVFGIIGILYVVTDRDKALPLFGKIKIIR